MLAVNLVLFGPIGATIWAVQMMWIPITAAGIINGIGHYWGYRNFACADASTNIVPWGILIGGEELHNNHHAYGTSAKLSSRWYEFDIGWMYIRMLEALKLATVRKVAPQVKFDRAKAVPDLATLQAVITHRYAVATSYARSLKAACATEIAALRARHAHIDLPNLRRIKRWLASDEPALTEPSARASRRRSTTARCCSRSTPCARSWRRCGDARRNRRSSCSRGCRTGAIAPKRRALRRSRSSRCSSSATRSHSAKMR